MQFYTFPGKFGQGFAPDSILINSQKKSDKNLTLVFEQDFFFNFSILLFSFHFLFGWYWLILLVFCLVLANTLVAAMLVLAYLFFFNLDFVLPKNVQLIFFL